MRLSRLFAPVLALALGTTAMATDLTQMTDAEKAAFGAQVRAYLLENPEVLQEAIQVLQDRQQQAADVQDQQVLKDYHDAIFNDPASWVGGNPQGDITVVEFMDYRCTYCRKAYSEIEDLVKTDGNVRFVLKEFPILGEDSVASSRFAIAVRLVGGDDAYKKAHDALIVLRGSPDTATLTRLAGDLGVDAKAVMDRMNSDEVTQIIAANHAIASKLNISGTPTFVIGNTLVRGYVPEDQMKQVVEQERAG